MRYGHHLFEGIACLWGLDIDWVRSLSSAEHHDIVQIHYVSGLDVILEFIKDIQLPIQFKAYSTVDKEYSVPFTDFFYSFRAMLQAFVTMVETGKQPIPFQGVVGIARIILAGDISKQMDGAYVSPTSLKSIDNHY